MIGWSHCDVGEAVHSDERVEIESLGGYLIWGGSIDETCVCRFSTSEKQEDDTIL